MDEFSEVLQVQRHLGRVVAVSSESHLLEVQAVIEVMIKIQAHAHMRTCSVWEVLPNGIELLGQSSALPAQPWP